MNCIVERDTIAGSISNILASGSEDMIFTIILCY